MQKQKNSRKSVKNLIKSILSCTLVLALILGVLPIDESMTEAQADTPASKTITGLGVGTIGDPIPGDQRDETTGSVGELTADRWSKVYFGSKDTPILYNVLKVGETHFTSSENPTLLLNSVDILENRQFHSEPLTPGDVPDHNMWAISGIKTYLNGTFLAGKFTDAEIGAIAASTKSNKVDGYDGNDQWPGNFESVFAELKGEQIFLLDEVEAANNTYGFQNLRTGAFHNTRNKELNGILSNWWTRSTPSGSCSTIVSVSPDGGGSFEEFACRVQDDHGVSPAFNIYLSSVIFSSELSSETKTYKLTIADTGNRNIWIRSGKEITRDSATSITVPYTVDAGSNHVSLLITNLKDSENRETTWTAGAGWNAGAVMRDYQTVAVTETSGTVTFTVPEDYQPENGSLKFWLLAEQVNEGNATDYASAPIAVTVPHWHNFTYSVGSGAHSDTITATCSNAGCPLTDKKVSLVIVAPELNTYGGTGSASAALTGRNEFNTATSKSVAITDIKYVGRDGTTYTESTTAPTGAGKYTAKVTVEGKTASVNYEIGKGRGSIITTPAARTLTCNGSMQELITAGSASGGTMLYAIGADATTAPTSGWNIEIPSKAEAGTYHVWYRIEGDRNWFGADSFEPITVVIAEESTTPATDPDSTQENQATTTDPNPAQGNQTTTTDPDPAQGNQTSATDPDPTQGNQTSVTDPKPTQESQTSATDPNHTSTNTDPVGNTELVADKAEEKTEKKPEETAEPSFTTKKNTDGSLETNQTIENEDGTVTNVNEKSFSDGTTEVKEETRDSKGNGTLSTEKKDADGNLISKTEGTIKVSKKGNETIKSATENADGSREEKTQKTYKRDEDGNQKVTTSTKKTDAEGNTEQIKTTEVKNTLGETIVTQKRTVTSSEVKVTEERQYSVSVNGRVKLTSLASDDEKVTVPETIEVDGKTRTIKSISKNAMKGNKTIKEVVIEENITTICTGAFKNCKNLELIELTGSVKKIYKNAFKGIAENAKFVIKASEEDFERIVELIKKSGVSYTVKFERV